MALMLIEISIGIIKYIKGNKTLRDQLAYKYDKSKFDLGGN
jgi:hypothetical protein